MPNLNYHGEYQLILKINVNELRDLSKAASKINKIARALGYLLTYVTGLPLTTNTKDFYGSKKKMLEFNEVEGWITNYDDVSFEFDKKENPEHNHLIINISEITNWSSYYKNPIHDLITAYKNYQALDDITKTLIRYHTLALLHEYDVKYLIIGKALEIAKILLPEPNDNKISFRKLPKEIQNEFRGRDISWLYKMSNFRIETRHAINKNSLDIFHSEMTDEEYYDFMYLSDFLIRNLIREKLKLEPIIIIRK